MTPGTLHLHFVLRILVVRQRAGVTQFRFLLRVFLNPCACSLGRVQTSQTCVRDSSRGRCSCSPLGLSGSGGRTSPGVANKRKNARCFFFPRWIGAAGGRGTCIQNVRFFVSGWLFFAGWGVVGGTTALTSFCSRCVRPTLHRWRCNIS